MCIVYAENNLAASSMMKPLKSAPNYLFLLLENQVASNHPEAVASSAFLESQHHPSKPSAPHRTYEEMSPQVWQTTAPENH